MDVSNRAQVSDALSKIPPTFLPIDFLVNNAGKLVIEQANGHYERSGSRTRNCGKFDR